MKLYPLKFNNIFKETIWGGDSMRKHLSKPVDSGTRIGESWEVSQHPNGTSIVKDGFLKDLTLNEVIAEYAAPLLGKRIAGRYEKLPLLIKFIDARDILSIQVHPNDSDARKINQVFGKTEAWYIIHAEPGSKMICGFNHATTREEIKAGLADASLNNTLNTFTVKGGECIFVPAGTVHAIGAGVLLYEVQQVSDITYRLYDWGRIGNDGKPRDLHVEESLNVINYNDIEDHIAQPVKMAGIGFEREVLVVCDYFVLEKYYITGNTTRTLPDRFEILTAISGSGSIKCNGKEYPVGCGETVLVPACSGKYNISGKDLIALLSWVPENRDAGLKELELSGNNKIS